MSISKTDLTKELLFEIEWRYRNYGNIWAFTDLPLGITKNLTKLDSLIEELESKGVIRRFDNNRQFEILNVPSNIEDFKKHMS